MGHFLGIGFLSAGFFMILFFGLAAFGIIFWIMMLVDALKRPFKNEIEKLIWVLVIIFLHIAGAAIYYFMVKRENSCCGDIKR